MTRHDRYELRRRRYARRLKRRRASYPYVWFAGPFLVFHERRDGPYVFAGDGSRQQPVAEFIKHPVNGPIVPGYTEGGFDVSAVGYKRPPHVHAHGVHPPGTGHGEEATRNYHHRAQTYRGKKLGKLKGQDYIEYKAWAWALYLSHVTGTWYFPPWDPKHRQPVWVDWPDLP